MKSEWRNANTTIGIASDEAYRRALSSVRGPRPFVGSNYWQINCDNEVPGRRTGRRIKAALYRIIVFVANRQLQARLTVYLLGQRICIFVVVRVSIVFFVSRIPFRLFMANPKVETYVTVYVTDEKLHYETIENHRCKDVNLSKIKKKWYNGNDTNGPSCMEAKDYRDKRYFHIFVYRF